MRTAQAAAAFLAVLLFGAVGFAGAEPPARFRDPALLRIWQEWVDEAVAESLRSGKPVVIVDKLGRRSLLVTAGKVVDRYAVEMGGNALADKLYEGDEATPEGLYKITEKRGRGQTSFYRALMLDYPTEEDRREHAEARRQGLVPRGRGPGGLIEIHGMGGRGFDWTLGCVAITNDEMDRLFAAVSVGTKVVIVGTARVPGDP